MLLLLKGTDRTALVRATRATECEAARRGRRREACMSFAEPCECSLWKGKENYTDVPAARECSLWKAWTFLCGPAPSHFAHTTLHSHSDRRSLESRFHIRMKRSHRDEGRRRAEDDGTQRRRKEGSQGVTSKRCDICSCEVPERGWEVHVAGVCFVRSQAVQEWTVEALLDARSMDACMHGPTHGLTHGPSRRDPAQPTEAGPGAQRQPRLDRALHL